MTADAFREAYAAHRAHEGRGYRGDMLAALPYLQAGPWARQWAVRARSYEALVRRVVTPPSRPLDVLDIGAGNGWLSHRLARLGHRCTALDIRDDTVDGLGAARELLRSAPGLFHCVAASFDAMPFAAASFDVGVFNAALHYATDLPRTLAAARHIIRPGGALVILDSPFYARDADGAAMVAEKKKSAGSRFGAQADVLLGLDFIEYLTPARLAAAAPDLAWTRIPVRYPAWYELRPLWARLKGGRRPSRFDLWVARP